MERGMLMLFNILQLMGGAVLAIGQIPQIVQIIKTRSARDLNLRTYVFMTAGISMMEAYAVNLVLHGSGGAFLITNSAALASAVLTLLLVLRFGRRHRAGRRQRTLRSKKTIAKKTF
jgi:MtN3 and saliva related transmembrane protein